MNFLNSGNDILYILFIFLIAVLGLFLVFAFQIFIIYIIAKLIFRFMLKFLSEAENRNLKNFDFMKKENKEE